MKNLYKKIILASISIFTLNSIAQTTIHLENFDAVVAPTMPSIINSNTGDWLTDQNFSNGGVVPECNVAGTSSLNVLAGAASGGIEEVVFGPFNATAYSSIKVSWNGYRTTGAPTLSVSFSTDGVAYTNVAFTDVATDDAWHASGNVNLPFGASAAPTLFVKMHYDMGLGGAGGSYIAFDDWKLAGTQSPVFYWKGNGFNLNLLSSWGNNTDGSGSNPVDFISASQVFNIVNGTVATLSGNWAVSGASVKVVVGDGVTWFPNFTVPAAFSFVVSGGANITVSNSGTLTLQNLTLPTAAAATFTTGSTVNYAQAGVVNIMQVPHSNLTISGGANKTQTGSLIINGILNLNGSNLIAGNSPLLILTLNGTMTGTGAVQTTSLSNVTINGTGSFGTLTFSSLIAPTSLRNLVLNRTAAGVFALGSDTKVFGVFTQTNGSVNLNGKLFTLNGAVTFPATAANGVLIGSSTSSVIIQGAGAITNSLLMDQSSASTKTLFDLTLNKASSLAFGNSIEILNSITPTLGAMNVTNVTLKSTSALKARLGIVGGSVSGNLIVETFIPGGSAGWANLGPAGVSGLTVNSWDGGSGSATGIAMSCTGCINDAASPGGYFVSIQGDPTGTEVYTELTVGDALTPGVGYWVFVGSDLISAIDITQTNSGPVVSGNVPSGTGFVSNPYASPVSVPALQASNPSISAVDIWDAASNAFVTYNGGLPAVNSVLPMGQGFYARGAGVITFHETDKTTQNGAGFSLLKTAATSTIGNVLELDVTSSTGEVDKTYIRFHGSATPLFDHYLDGYKRYVTPGYMGTPANYSHYTTIATVNTSGDDCAINSLPYALSSDAIIPVIVKVSTTGQYTISPVGISAITSGACVILKDKLLGINHDLRTGSYVCNINDTTSTARFELTVCANIAAGINEPSSSVSSSLILINQDGNGAYVSTNFETNTKATISAYNMMGQKLMADKEVEGKQTTTYLNLGNVQSQVVIIKVTTAKESSVKKLFINEK